MKTAMKDILRINNEKDDEASADFIEIPTMC